MKINFTKKQYKELLDLVSLGDWMSNATREDPEKEDIYKETYQYVLSFAKEFQQDERIVYDQKFNQYFPTLEYEEELQDIIEHYDEYTFWEELPRYLAWKEIHKLDVKNIDPEELKKKLIEYGDKYRDEIEENGLNNIGLKK